MNWMRKQWSPLTLAASIIHYFVSFKETKLNELISQLILVPFAVPFVHYFHCGEWKLMKRIRLRGSFPSIHQFTSCNWMNEWALVALRSLSQLIYSQFRECIAGNFMPSCVHSLLTVPFTSVHFTSVASFGIQLTYYNSIFIFIPDFTPYCYNISSIHLAIHSFKRIECRDWMKGCCLCKV